MDVESKVSEDRPVSAITDITGVVLAGGASRRYGSNKALVELEGAQLIELVVNRMAQVFEQVLIITNTPDIYAHLGRPMLQDLVRGLGPIGGIMTAMTAIFPRPAFFVACDMPALNPTLIRHLAGLLEGYDAVVPRIGRHLEALHSVYGPGCLAPIRGLVKQGRRQILQVFDTVAVRYVEEPELRRFDPKLVSFCNINSPRELELFQQSDQRT